MAPGVTGGTSERSRQGSSGAGRPLKTFDPTAMNVPHSVQNTRPGGLGASQSQQVTVGASDGAVTTVGTTTSAAAEPGGAVVTSAASDARGGPGGAAAGATGGSGSLAVGLGVDGGGGMDAPDLGRRTAADDTSESHSPQNAVSAWTGAPHAGQMS